jgi:hypothetical protein
LDEGEESFLADFHLLTRPIYEENTTSGVTRCLLEKKSCECSFDEFSAHVLAVVTGSVLTPISSCFDRNFFRHGRKSSKDKRKSTSSSVVGDQNLDDDPKNRDVLDKSKFKDRDTNVITSTINHHAGVGEGGLDTATGAGDAAINAGTSDVQDANAAGTGLIGATGADKGVLFPRQSSLGANIVIRSYHL